MIDNNFFNTEKSKEIPFIFVITSVWLILLALCALIGIIIVPIETSSNSYFVQLLFGGGKVLVSMFFVLLWLIGWYKAITFLLYLQFYIADLNSSPKEN
ncbi:MAG: hypothetical protein ACW99A_14750 [Candidatus Kariarchaeaceae archaeon]|jgi:hypothetical protein